MKVKPFHEWKDAIVKEDSKKHNVGLYFRWSKDDFYRNYGLYVQKMRSKTI